jgi:hypothetical protein
MSTQKIADLLFEGHYSDLVLVACNERYKVHSHVLQTKSKYFAQQLPQRNLVVLDDTVFKNPELFDIVHKFLYEQDFNWEGDILQLVELYNYFGLLGVETETLHNHVSIKKRFVFSGLKEHGEHMNKYASLKSSATLSDTQTGTSVTMKFSENGRLINESEIVKFLNQALGNQFIHSFSLSYCLEFDDGPERHNFFSPYFVGWDEYSINNVDLYPTMGKTSGSIDRDIFWIIMNTNQ